MLRSRKPVRCSTASRKVLLAVPVLTSTPPSMGNRSSTATLLSSFAAWIAALWPAGPEPMTIKS